MNRSASCSLSICFETYQPSTWPTCPPTPNVLKTTAINELTMLHNFEISDSPTVILSLFIGSSRVCVQSKQAKRHSPKMKRVCCQRVWRKEHELTRLDKTVVQTWQNAKLKEDVVFFPPERIVYERQALSRFIACCTTKVRSGYTNLRTVKKGWKSMSSPGPARGGTLYPSPGGWKCARYVFL